MFLNCLQTIVFIFFGLAFFVVYLMLCVDIGLLSVAFCTLSFEYNAIHVFVQTYFIIVVWLVALNHFLAQVEQAICPFFLYFQFFFCLHSILVVQNFSDLGSLVFEGVILARKALDRFFSFSFNFVIVVLLVIFGYQLKLIL